MIDARKDIIFRDENYKEKFRIKDGDSIKITIGYNGEEIVRKCRWIDAAHMNVGSTPLHMDEFMEKQAQAGNRYEPVPNPKPKLDVLLAEPGKEPRNAEIPMNLAALRKMLGGPLETAPLGKSAAIVRGRDGNGAIVVCGLKDGQITSLHPYDAQKYRREFADKIPDVFSRTHTLQEQLAEAKKEAAGQNRAKISAPPEKAAGRRKSGAEH